MFSSLQQYDFLTLAMLLAIAGVICFLLLVLFRQISARHRFEIEVLEKSIAQLNSQICDIEQKNLMLTEQLSLAKAEQHAREMENSAHKATLATLPGLNARLSRLDEERNYLQVLNAELKARLDEQEKQYHSELKLLREGKEIMTKEFENTANRIFEAKQQKFSDSSKTQLDGILSPFKQQIKDFNKRVEDIYHKESSERNQLVGQITELHKQTQQISADAVNLANALKGDNKAQGNWGEIVLERLLEQSGLQKGREYETQVTLHNTDGKARKPDVLIRLPDNKDIVVDSKLSLVSYERFCSANNDQDKDRELKSHIESLRNHIKGLNLKEYENLEGIRTLDFVFIFIPIEAAFLLAMQHSPNLFKEAHNKNIVLVSPSSLMVALRTVETIWRHEKQNENAEEIARRAGKLYDKFVAMADAFKKVGEHMDRAKDEYSLAYGRLKSGKGNLVGQVENIRKLGAKTSKSLTPDLLLEVNNEIEELEASDNKEEIHEDL